MPGLAKTDAFMLGTATLMLGPQSALFDLDIDKSVGLFKNFMLKSAPSFTELTQGIKNTLVYSLMTGNDVTAEGELYEYTGANITYAAGLDGSSVVTPTIRDQSGTIASTTTITTAETGFTAGAEGVGDMVMVQKGTQDQIMIRRVASTTTGLITVDPALPTDFAVGDTVLVTRCNNIALGSQEDQPFLAAKVVGTLANGDEAVILMPKVRITSGLQYSFKTDAFDHIPLSMKLYDLVTTDPFFAAFQHVGPQNKPAKAMLSSKQ